MSLSILVVDDEPDVADLFRRRFRRESRQGTYVMHFATSGVEALDRLAEEIQPTLVAVLSDINMPGMDGLELLGEIKQRHPNLPEGGAAAEGATNEAQVDLLYRQIGQLKVENDFWHESSATEPGGTARNGRVHEPGVTNIPAMPVAGAAPLVGVSQAG